MTLINKYSADLTAIKDKFLVVILMGMFLAIELCFKSMHWTTHTRVKTAIGNQMGKYARWLHFNKTGKHPIEEIMKDNEKNRHKKFNRYHRG